MILLSPVLLTAMFIVLLDSHLARYTGYLRRLYRLKTPDSASAATAMLTTTTLLTRHMDDVIPRGRVPAQCG